MSVCSCKFRAKKSPRKIATITNHDFRKNEKEKDGHKTTIFFLLLLFFCCCPAICVGMVAPKAKHQFHAIVNEKKRKEKKREFSCSPLEGRESRQGIATTEKLPKMSILLNEHQSDRCGVVA